MLISNNAGKCIWFRGTVTEKEVLVKPVTTGVGGRGQVVEGTSVALLLSTPFDINTWKVKGFA